MRRATTISLVTALAVTAAQCGDDDSTREAAATQELAEAIRALPVPSSPTPTLYLQGDDSTLSPSDPPDYRSTYYLYDESMTFEYSHALDSDSKISNPEYWLVMASKRRMNVVVELVLDHANDVTVLARDTLVIHSESFQPYEGRLAVSETVLEAGDRVLFRLIVSRSGFPVGSRPVDFGLQCCSSVSVPGLSSILSEDVREHRESALIWFATHTKAGLDSEVFRNFHRNLDTAIVAGRTAQWAVGHDLTTSGKPCVLRWTDVGLEAADITEADAEERDLGARSVTFRLSGTR